MKKYWLIQCTQQDFPSGVKIYAPKNNLPIMPGDSFIAVCNHDQSQQKLSGYGTVEGILSMGEKNFSGSASGKIPGLNNSLYIFQLETSIKRLSTTLNLEDYRYSLLLFAKKSVPFSHKNRAYTKLSNHDFRIITQGKIFLARTAFGKLLNALPCESKYDFIACVVKTFDTTDLRSISYKTALNFLFDFIDQRMKCSGEAIVASGKALTRLLINQNIPPSHIGIFDERELKERLILKQSAHIEHFLEQDSTLDLRTNVLGMIEENLDNETCFEKTFRNYNWPINL